MRLSPLQGSIVVMINETQGLRPGLSAVALSALDCCDAADKRGTSVLHGGLLSPRQRTAEPSSPLRAQAINETPNGNGTRPTKPRSDAKIASNSAFNGAAGAAVVSL